VKDLTTNYPSININKKKLTSNILKQFQKGEWLSPELKQELNLFIEKSQCSLAESSIKTGMYSSETRKLFELYIHSLLFQVHTIETLSTNSGSNITGVDTKNINKTFICKYELLKNLKKIRTNKIKPLKISTATATATGTATGTYIKICKNDNKTLAVPSILDRATQVLLLSLLDPIIEPHSDLYSFGFRKGRSSIMAVSILQKILQKKLQSKGETAVTKNRTVNKETDTETETETQTQTQTQIQTNTNTELQTQTQIQIQKQKQKQKQKKTQTQTQTQTQKNTQYIWEANIRKSLDQINHDWLLKNVPIPPKYFFLLEGLLLKEAGSFEYTKSNSEVFSTIESLTYLRESIISPLLINFTLNGMEPIIEKARLDYAKNTKGAYLITGDLEGIRLSIKDVYRKRRQNWGGSFRANTKGWVQSSQEKSTESRTGAGYEPKKVAKLVEIKERAIACKIVRFADKFIVISDSENLLNIIQVKIKEFLKLRGLEINPDNSRVIKFGLNKPFSFLGYTFNFLTRTKHIRNKFLHHRKQEWRLTGRAQLFIYPSKFEFKLFKKDIIGLFRNSINLSAYDLISLLNPKVKGWVNYFSFSNSTGTLKSLKKFLYNRIRTWMVRKHDKAAILWLNKQYLLLDSLQEQHGLDFETNKKLQFKILNNESAKTNKWNFYGLALKDRNNNLYKIPKLNILKWPNKIKSIIGFSVVDTPTDREILKTNIYNNRAQWIKEALKLAALNSNKFYNIFDSLWERDKGTCFLCKFPFSIEEDITKIGVIKKRGETVREVFEKKDYKLGPFNKKTNTRPSDTKVYPKRTVTNVSNVTLKQEKQKSKNVLGISKDTPEFYKTVRNGLKLKLGNKNSKDFSATKTYSDVREKLLEDLGYNYDKAIKQGRQKALSNFNQKDHLALCHESCNIDWHNYLEVLDSQRTVYTISETGLNFSLNRKQLKTQNIKNKQIQTKNNNKQKTKNKQNNKKTTVKITNKRKIR
jgi:hypothetical protein